MVLPLSLLKTAQNHPMLIELKNGETYNGMLIACDSWMNVHLRDAICTSKEGDKFMKIPEVVELVKDEVKEVRRQQKENRTMKRNFAKGARGGGSGGGGRPVDLDKTEFSRRLDRGGSYQQPPDPYGFSRINNSQPMTTYEFLRTAEESTRGAFQSIEHVASAFLSIASLLNSTYGAVFNSFRAIISVVEQLKSLKHFLVSTFLLSLTRWIRFLWRRLLASLRVRPRNYANSASIWAGINGELEQSKKSSNFGTLIFWIIAIGGPLLIIKYFLQQIRENARELISDWATGQAEHYTAQAKIFLCSKN
uniref:Sm domain-containing protein n=1 Tax=Meloidogyne javanica TaxID=6303 RepID=A0A915NDJ9_MELJA